MDKLNPRHSLVWTLVDDNNNVVNVLVEFYGNRVVIRPTSPNYADRYVSVRLDHELWSEAVGEDDHRELMIMHVGEVLAFPEKPQ